MASASPGASVVQAQAFKHPYIQAVFDDAKAVFEFFLNSDHLQTLETASEFIPHAASIEKLLALVSELVTHSNNLAADVQCETQQS